MRQFIMKWLWFLIVGFSAFVGLPAGAQQSSETIEAHGRWIGELLFKRHGQQDVVCKIAVSVRKYQIKDGFNCPQVWWLVPGFSWSIIGKVEADGTLTSADIKWGEETYAELTGTLRQARGRFSEQISYGTIRSTAGGDAVLQLRPEPGATREGKPIGAADGTDPKRLKAGVVKTSDVEDGTYSGKVTCGSGFSVKLEIDGFMANTELRIKAGARDDYYSNSHNLKSLEPIRIPFTVPDSIGDGEVEIGLEDRHPTAVVHALKDCDLVLEKQGSSGSVASEKAATAAAALNRYDGRYAGKGLCQSIRDANVVDFEADILVQNGQARASITMQLSFSRDYDVYTATVDDSGLVRIPIRYGAVVELRLADDPPTFEIAEHCNFSMTKSNGKPSGRDAAKSASVHEGVYYGKGLCTSTVNFTTVELEVEGRVSAGRGIVKITKRTKDGVASFEEFEGPVGQDGTIHVDGTFNATYVVKLTGEPPQFESVGQCKFPMTKKAGSEHPISVIAAGTYDGVYTGTISCTGALGGSSDYSPYQLQIKATVTDARADIQFRATGRASAENRYDFSTHLSKQGTLNYEVKSGEIWTFRFGDDPPIARDRDNCVVKLEKKAPAKPLSGGTMVPTGELMKFTGTWQSNIDRVSRNVSLNDVVVDHNGVITRGTFWSDGARDLNCSFMAIAVDGTFQNNVLSYTHDNGCGPITTTVTFDGKVGVGEWRQGSLQGTIELTRK